MTDPIADMLARLRNANSAYHDTVAMPHSKIKVNIAEILQREGYIEGYEVNDDPARPGNKLTVYMKYTPERKRTISGIKRVSKPGLRVYKPWLDEAFVTYLAYAYYRENEAGFAPAVYERTIAGSTGGAGKR